MRDIEKWIELYKAWGVNLIPLKTKDKAPIVAWKEYQTRKATESELKAWKARGITNFGVVCGRVSGNLVVIDVDRADLFKELGCEELASGTFTVKTGKGYHIYLRSKEEGEKRESLKWNEREEIRFQGEGTYVVSAGSVHPTGKIYDQYINSPLKIEEADSGLFEEIERRWKKFHGLDKIEEKEKTTSWRFKRSRGIEDFKNQLSLKDIVGRYVSEIEDYRSYFKCRCPFHTERNPSFAGYKDTNTYYCFGCAKCGDVITFVKEIEHEDFIGAIRKIEKLTGVKYFEKEEKERNTPRLIKPAEVEEMILDGHSFATLRDTEEIIYYRDGCWRFNGEVVVKELIERILKEIGQKETVTNYFRNEVLGHLKCETYIERKRLNAEKMKVNLMNGVYDIETGELLPHDPTYYFTYEVPVNYNKEAECKKIEKFLSEVLHAADIEVVLEFIGYCLIQQIPFHKALMFLGRGANGKSTLIELMRRFLGAGNTTSHSLHSLVNNRFLAADLYGRLANMYADISQEALWRTGFFKVLTGGDTISAEKKFKSPFTFVNTAKLIFSGNLLPRTFDDTDAFFRRWILVEFPNTFEGIERDVGILDRLTTEAEFSGFFNLVVSKLKRLLEQGRFSYEKTTEEIRIEYKEKSDPVYTFVVECVVEQEDSHETKEEVYSQYVQFCRENKLQFVDKKAFGKQLPCYITTKTSRRRDKEQGRVYCWSDIKLRERKEACSETPALDTFTCAGCHQVIPVSARYSLPTQHGQPRELCEPCFNEEAANPQWRYQCEACKIQFETLEDLTEHHESCESFKLRQLRRRMQRMKTDHTESCKIFQKRLQVKMQRMKRGEEGEEVRSNDGIEV